MLNHRRPSAQANSKKYPSFTDSTSEEDSEYKIKSDSQVSKKKGKTTSAMSSSNSAVAEFDALRREATKLERHLEDNVARYQQLAQRMAKGDSFTTDQSSTSSSLLDSTEAGKRTGSMGYNNGKSNRNNEKNKNINDEESSLSSDISRTIAAMSDLINNRMSPASEKTGRSQHVLLVKRYREILFDCSTDFQKTSAAVARRREAMELFSKKDGSIGGGMSDDIDLDTEQLLRERNSISSSLTAASNVIGQAEEIRNDLRTQGLSLKSAQATVLTIASNVPGLNYLIDSIRRKRNRDDMIVSCVIAACILFTLWYIFS